MTDIAAELAAVLGKVDRPGDFFCAGRGEFFPPRIEVEGVGPIALPLLPEQARQLIAASVRAPYGRGEKTIYDDKVRRTWQIDAAKVRIGGKSWPAMLDEIVKRAAAGLGVDGRVAAELYKLLIYDEGSFFVSHRDTEKAPGMFATLVVTLPSRSEGGDLIVRHGDREARLDLRTEEPSEFAFAAFYADCVHEVTEVTAGCRATLVFNLLREGKGRALKPPGYEAETRQAAALLTAWAAAPKNADEDAGEKLVYLLEHAYTPAELAFDKLKGVDAAIARLLAEAAPLAECDLSLALLTIEESGSAEYNDDYAWRRSRYRRDKDDDEDNPRNFEIIEVNDSQRTLSHWRRIDGSEPEFGELPFLDAEISPPDALEKLKPEKQHFHEATGNEGASFERTYARGALVLWPSARVLAVRTQAGVDATLPYLGELIDQGRKAEATELAGHMLAKWSARGLGWSRDRSSPSKLGLLILSLVKLGDVALVERALEKWIASEGHPVPDNAAILLGSRLLPGDVEPSWLRRLVEAKAALTPAASAALLAMAVAGPFRRMPAALVGAAEALVAALPGDPQTAPKNQWGRPIGEALGVQGVADLIRALDRIDGGLATQAANHLLAWPRAYGFDEILIPALKALKKSGGGPAFEVLRTHAVAYLQARASEALEPPSDWRRSSEVGCKCAHCAQLSAHLADPARPTWTLKALQDIRSHVELRIRESKVDLKTETIRKGSPHSLVCSKTQASYELRVGQRKRDLADIEALAL